MDLVSKRKNHIRTISYAMLCIALSSCAAINDQQTGASPDTATGQAIANQNQTPTSQITAIAEIDSIDNAERLALINEINRDGQIPAAPGYREQIPTPGPVEGDDVVELNYEQAQLRLVLEELADALDMTIIIDPSINSVVSIRTAADRPLGQADIWPLMQLLARDAGVVIERAGNVFNARVLDSNLPAEIITPDQLGSGTAARVLQITPLRFISAEAASESITPMLEPEGVVRRITSSNTLAIEATENQLMRINQVISLIDTDPFSNQGIRLYQLSNSNALEVATELEEILQLIEGPLPAYQVKGIERINAILVTAPATRGFDEVQRWVRILDADAQEQVEQLFHYQVKNLSAVELAETLTNVFDRDDDEGPVVVSQPGLIGLPADNDNGDQSGADTVPPSAFTTRTTVVSADLNVTIVADERTNSLLIRSTARDYRQLLTTINQLDTVPLQVMINAVIAQITLTDANEFGVDWSRVAADSAVNDISTATSTSFLPGAGLGGLLFSKTFIDGAAQVDATLEAISVNNDVRLLARPSLTVTNNQEGEIQIGAQVPVEQGESVGGGGIATTNIQYRDTGIVLSITPQINRDGVVNLIIRQELSSVDSSAAGVNNNPVFNNQEINTTVVVRNGENVVLGGLIQTDNENLNSGVPGLNRIPVLGRLFSYQQDSVERRELFIVLRPEIINLNEQNSVQYAEILERFELASELIQESGI